MVDEKYDLCIVGAGLAGASLAYAITPDFDVCLVEKKSFDELGRKPCGGAVHRTWFKNGGVDPENLDAVSSVSSSIKLHLRGEDFKAEFPPGNELLILNREKLVKGFARSALNSGCDFFVNEARPKLKGGKVDEVRAGARKITAKTYIDASGVDALLRRQFQEIPSSSYFTGYREIVDTELGDGLCHVFQKNPNYAFWVFPRGDETNIGGGFFRKDDTDLREEIRKLKDHLGIDGKVLDSGYGSLPSAKPIDLVYGNTVAIGDAGVTVNPLTGGGIGPTMKTVDILANNLREGNDLTEFQQEYRKRVASSYGENYYFSKILLKLQRFFWEKAAKLAFQEVYGGEKVDG